MHSVRNYITSLLKANGCENVRTLGNNIHCKCPFHKPRYNDTSFSINWRKSPYYYNCFSCGEKGVLEGLRDRFSDKSVSMPVVNAVDVLNEEYQEFIEYSDRDESPGIALNQEPMYRYMRKRSRENHDVLDVDYIVNKYGLYYCDRGDFHSRIIMPIFMHGEIKGYNNRSIKNTRLKSKNQKNIKWGNYLYGWDQAIGNRICVLVEGAFDLFQIESVIRGRCYSVMSIMGTVFNQERRTLLQSVFTHVILYFDNDSPGAKTTSQYYNGLRDHMSVGIADTDDCSSDDPGSQSAKEIITALRRTTWNTK
jgi:DNA primase